MALLLKTVVTLLVLFLTFWEIMTSMAIKEGSKEKFFVEKLESNKTHKIIGGYSCSIQKHPYVVSLQTVSYGRLRHFCAGSLLSKSMILTARHCLSRKCSDPTTIIVIAGSQSAYHSDPYREDLGMVSNNQESQSSPILHCYLYPGSTAIFDIALAKLKKAMVVSSNVGYVKLPFNLNHSDPSLEKVCEKAEVIGWGHQYAKDPFDEPLSTPIPKYKRDLQCLILPVISQSECARRTRQVIFSTMLCTYREKHDACHGDSGGPLMCNGYQYGIVSSGNGCAFAEYPGIFARVQFFEKFILNGSTNEYTEFERNLTHSIILSATLMILVSAVYFLI